MPDAAGADAWATKPLEVQLVAAATGSEAERRAFEAALPGETLFVATREPGEPGVAGADGGWRTLAAGSIDQLLSVPLADGRWATAVFTSPRPIAEAYGAGTGFLAVEGRALLEMIEERPAFLNP